MTDTGKLLSPPSFGMTTRKIFVIAVPVMLQNLTEYLLMSISTAFMGHYSTEGLSALANVASAHFTLMTIFFSLAQGATILIAQAVGAKDTARASRIAETAFFFNTLISLGYLLFWFFLGRQVFVLIGARGPILSMATDYMRIVSFIYVTFGMTLAAHSLFLGVGKPVPIFFGSLIKTVLAVALSWVLIFGRLGFPRLGVIGAGIATLIAELAGQILVIVWALRQKDLPMSRRGILKPDRGIFARILKVGVPVSAENMLWAGSQTALLSIMNRFNPLSAGYFSLLNTILNLSVHIYWSISTAALTLVGQAWGAKKTRDAGRAANLCFLYSLAVCVAVGVLFLVNPGGVVGVFTRDPDAVTQVTPLLTLLVFIMFPKAVNIVSANSIRATGNTRWMLYTQAVGTVLIIGMAHVFVNRMGMGLPGLMLAILIDEIWRAAINYAKFQLKMRFDGSPNRTLAFLAR